MGEKMGEDFDEGWDSFDTDFESQDFSENISVQEEIPMDIPDEFPAEVPDDIPDEFSAEIPDDIPDEFPAEIPDDIPDVFSTEIPDDTLSQGYIDSPVLNDGTADPVAIEGYEQASEVSEEIDSAADMHEVSEETPSESEHPALDAMQDYMAEHNYGREDAAEFMNDPEWQALNRDLQEEDGIDRDPIQDMQEYMSSHNYGLGDTPEFHQDPEWQEINDRVLESEGAEPVNYEDWIPADSEVLTSEEIPDDEVLPETMQDSEEVVELPEEETEEFLEEVLEVPEEYPEESPEIPAENPGMEDGPLIEEGPAIEDKPEIAEKPEVELEESEEDPEEAPEEVSEAQDETPEEEPGLEENPGPEEAPELEEEPGLEENPGPEEAPEPEKEPTLEEKPELEEGPAIVDEPEIVDKPETEPEEAEGNWEDPAEAPEEMSEDPETEPEATSGDVEVLSEHPALDAMSQYMQDHNYGIEDAMEYRQDSEWQRLNNEYLIESGMDPINYGSGIEQTEGGAEVVDGVSQDLQMGDFETMVSMEDPDFYTTGEFFEQGINEYGFTGTCGETTQANTLNKLFETNKYTENGVLDVAVNNGLCDVSEDPDAAGGTTTENFVELYEKLDEQMGGDKIEVGCYDYDRVLSPEQVAQEIENGSVVNVAVDANRLWDNPQNYVDEMGNPVNELYSDHWIAVSGVNRDSGGKIVSFDIIDSGGGETNVSLNKYIEMCYGNEYHTIKDPTAIVVSRKDRV